MATREEDLLGFPEIITGHRGTLDAKSSTPKSNTLPEAIAVAENLNKIIETKEQLAAVKEHLEKLFDILESNPSLVTRASAEFGRWSTWKKVGVGLGVAAPAVVAGIAASMSVLVILGSTVGATYTATAAILEDHNTCTVNTTKNLKNSLFSIVQVLQVTILALDNIRLQLTLQVAKFKEENSKLTTHVSTLGDKVKGLSIQIDILMNTSEFIYADKIRLEEELLKLNKSSEQQRVLYEEQQALVEATVKDYDKNKLKLKDQIAELERTRSEMASVVGNTKAISEALDKAVTTLSGSAVADERKKQGLLSKLESFCTKEEMNAQDLLHPMSQTEGDFDAAARDLKANYEHDKKLLAEEERVVKEMEELFLRAITFMQNKENVSDHQNKQKSASALGKHGVFSKRAEGAGREAGERLIALGIR